jgi:hypothetical protein
MKRLSEEKPSLQYMQRPANVAIASNQSVNELIQLQARVAAFFYAIISALSSYLIIARTATTQPNMHDNVTGMDTNFQESTRNDLKYNVSAPLTRHSRSLILNLGRRPLLDMTIKPLNSLNAFNYSIQSNTSPQSSANAGTTDELHSIDNSMANAVIEIDTNIKKTITVVQSNLMTLYRNMNPSMNPLLGKLANTNLFLISPYTDHTDANWKTHSLRPNYSNLRVSEPSATSTVGSVEGFVPSVFGLSSEALGAIGLASVLPALLAATYSSETMQRSSLLLSVQNKGSEELSLKSGLPAISLDSPLAINTDGAVSPGFVGLNCKALSAINLALNFPAFVLTTKTSESTPRIGDLAPKELVPDSSSVSTVPATNTIGEVVTSGFVGLNSKALGAISLASVLPALLFTTQILHTADTLTLTEHQMPETALKSEINPLDFSIPKDSQSTEKKIITSTVNADILPTLLALTNSMNPSITTANNQNVTMTFGKPSKVPNPFSNLDILAARSQKSIGELQGIRQIVSRQSATQSFTNFERAKASIADLLNLPSLAALGLARAPIQHLLSSTTIKEPILTSKSNTDILKNAEKVSPIFYPYHVLIVGSKVVNQLQSDLNRFKQSIQDSAMAFEEASASRRLIGSAEQDSSRRNPPELNEEQPSHQTPGSRTPLTLHPLVATTPLLNDTLNVTLPAETSDEDLRELERKINRLLTDQLNRFYGGSRL